MPFVLAPMRDKEGWEDNAEEEEYVADFDDEEDNNEEGADAVATINGLHVARSKPNDNESERTCPKEEPILSDGFCRLLRFWLP
jgi:hypothetical protein